MTAYTAVVLAAGSGRRMNASVPKQYMPINGKPLMLYSLMAFEASGVNDIMVVVAPGEVEYVRQEIVKKYGITKVSSIIEGGAERYDSVYKAISALDSEYVLIHDAARPFVTVDIINRCMSAVAVYSAVSVGMPSKDTIKLCDEMGRVLSTPDRNSTWIVQTPQCFELPLLKKAYAAFYSMADKNATDDAMIVEAIGQKVRMIKGDYSNLKVTTPEDVYLAQAILYYQNQKK